MTVKASRFSRCPVCCTEQPVSDWIDRPSEAAVRSGRFLLIHAVLVVRCEGSGHKVYCWWKAGCGPGTWPEGDDFPFEGEVDFAPPPAHKGLFLP